MSESSRQLAAIMFTDIVGYTALMGEDEEQAFELLKKNRQIQKPLIEKFNGRWLKEIGDGVLASFNTVSDAVYCAGAIQRACQDHADLNLRIGIHQGEVVFEGDDVFGDGVNIASRLEPLAPAGGIMVSESVRNNMLNKSGVTSKFAGEEQLKNVKHPVKTYLLSVAATTIDTLDYQVAKNKSSQNSRGKMLWGGALAALLILVAYFIYSNVSEKDADLENSRSTKPETISIAVLPFQNNSGDPEMEPFCDGMTDEVISRLTKISSIDKVVSRTSIMKYKGTQKRSPEIAEELGVTHILEGSFQRSGDQIKINLQLINGPLDDHFWSDDYQGEWGDIFTIQAAVAESVARNLDAQITDVEIESIQTIPTINKEAYDLFLQAEFQKNRQTERAFANAIPLYQKAIQLDSGFVRAYVGLSDVWSVGGLVWGMYDEQEAWGHTKKLLTKALEIDSTNELIAYQLHQGYFFYDWNFDLVEKYYQSLLANPLSGVNQTMAVVFPEKTGRYEEALNALEQRIIADPSEGINYFFKAEILMLQGKVQKAKELLQTADPLYGDNWWYLRESAKLHFYLEQHEISQNHLNRLITNFPDRPPLVLWLSAVYHQRNGDHKAATENIDQLNERYEEGTSGSPAWFIALYYCAIQEYDEAFTWLQRSYDRHEVEMTWLKEEPLLKPLRDDPRYQELYRKVGFPE